MKRLNKEFNLSSFSSIKDLSKSNVIKLNGCYHDAWDLLDRDTSLYTKSSVEFQSEKAKWLKNALSLIDIHIKQGSHPPSLKFAWENNIPQYELEKSDYSSGFQALKEIMMNADSMVVIGYTFPHYNREMDRFILQSFVHKSKINQSRKLIHIQNTPEGIQGNKERIEALCGLNDKAIVEHTYLEEFFIPSEL